MSESDTYQCGRRNPLQRSGSSQKDRLLATLQRDYVQIDEHSIADLLLFANRYAAHLNYFDLQHQLKGDWSEFFESDVSILITLIVKNDLAGYRRRYKLIKQQLFNELGELGGGPLPSVIADALPAFKQLFDYTLSLAAHLDKQIAELPSATGLKGFSHSVIQQQCSRAVGRLLGYYKVGINDTGADYKLIENEHRNPIEEITVKQRYTQEIIQFGLRASWLPENEKWLEYYLDLNPDDFLAAYGDGTIPMIQAADVEQRLRPVLPALQKIFDQLMKAYEKIINAAPQFLKETLNLWDNHPPHTALYIAFLKLFHLAQHHLNGLKERHLDYYFKEVLRLRERAAEPDEIHLIIELAKQVAEHLLPKGTAFKAGKDSEGEPVSYELSSDVVLNKAQVASLQSIYFTAEDSRLYASPVTNSLDGAGEPFKGTEASWRAFGPITRFRAGTSPVPVFPADGTVEEQELFNQINRVAGCGFAIGSSNLFLREGNRKVELILSVSKLDSSLADPQPNLWNDQLTVFFTSDKGWLKKNATATYQAGTLTVSCTISPAEGPVVPYDVAVHQDNFTLAIPIVKVIVHSKGAHSAYADLRNLQVTSITTKVTVGGIKHLYLQNDLSPLDPAKTFMPFGPVPHQGSRFIMGSNEVFQKPLTQLSFRFEWDGLKDFSDPFIPFSDINVSLSNFDMATETGKKILQSNLAAYQTDDRPSEQFEVDNPALFGKVLTRDFKYGDNPVYKVQAKEGFVAMSLENALGHQIFQHDYPLALVEMAKRVSDRNPQVINGLNFNFKRSFAIDSAATGIIKTIEGGKEIAVPDIVSDPNVLGLELGWSGEQMLLVAQSILANATADIKVPDPPYTPLAKQLTIDYTAVSTFTIDSALDTGFDRRPEYFFHLHPFGHREEHAGLREGGDNPSVVPLYNHEGEFYIGLRGTRAGQQISVLLQIAEGTANPLARPQEVVWSYLKENHWIPFQKADLVDQSNGLLQSGIVRLQLPRDIGVQNTWLESNLMWLRAHVTISSDAISDLILVEASALKVTFSDNDNADDVLAHPRPAGSISKLQRSDSAIKKIVQPFSSFGGRSKEPSSHFYNRVSERLRHKDRAITIWDYEHLVLEAFPEIYKVKCLNHTRVIELDNANGVDIELAPGYVLVVPIPDLRQRNAVDPLRPFTSLGTLSAIQAFLEKRISPHLRLDVRNPRFEPVQLDFKVKFHPDRDPILYTKILNADLIRFLSPWAYDGDGLATIDFGGKIHKSVLLDFVEELPYVDFITDFKVHQNPDGPDEEKRMDVEAAAASTGRSVLVSHQHHQFLEIIEKCSSP